MNIIQTEIPDVLIFSPQVFSDERGFFVESFHADIFERATGLKKTFVRDNHSHSTHGVLRGLHYQLAQPEGKLVRVLTGCVFDVVVDLRKSSPTFGRSVAVELSADNKLSLWVPEGFAHGFLVLSAAADVVYKSTNHYHPASERTVRWDDADLNIAWPLAALKNPAVLSAKDNAGVSFSNADVFL